MYSHNQFLLPKSLLDALYVGKGRQFVQYPLVARLVGGANHQPLIVAAADTPFTALFAGTRICFLDFPPILFLGGNTKFVVHSYLSTGWSGEAVGIQLPEIQMYFFPNGSIFSGLYATAAGRTGQQDKKKKTGQPGIFYHTPIFCGQDTTGDGVFGVWFLVFGSGSLPRIKY